jgi:hypothetical protein
MERHLGELSEVGNQFQVTQTADKAFDGHLIFLRMGNQFMFFSS